MAVRERGRDCSLAPWRTRMAGIRLVETREQHATGLRSHGVHDRRKSGQQSCSVRTAPVQADLRSALEIDFELRHHARECTKALPLR